MSEVTSQFKLPSGQTIELALGDITQEHVDAIVNAANQHLLHGGGVAGAIVRAGGHIIQDESDAWVQMHGHVSHAEPAFTSGGRLPCRYVIHAVGPVWGEGEEDRKLGEAVTGSLRLADRLKLHSIALPAISTGIFGFPVERAARIIFESIKKYFKENPTSGISLVRLTLYDSSTLAVFQVSGQIFAGLST